MALSRTKRKKGYSMLEILISLAIMAFSMTVMFNFIILSLQISIFSLGRSFVREEMSNVLTLVARDIRNSDIILRCDDTEQQGTCEFVFSGNHLKWQPCSDDLTRVCKMNLNDPANPVEEFRSSKNVKIEGMSFVKGPVESLALSKVNVIFTLVGSHSNTNYNIKNVVRQISISTRNY